jgi:DNA mismatch endonuclease (patch repair protein)
MQRQARRDTAPELAIRRELWRRGLRYRVDRSIIDGRRRHDIVFPSQHVAIDVHGCFWHSCPAHGSLPKANREWWQHKLEANRRRDADTTSRLSAAGWTHVVVWEHENVSDAADSIERIVRSANPPG